MAIRRLTMLVLLAAVAAPAVAAEYFKCADADGTVTYTDVPCEGGTTVALPPIQVYTPTPVPSVSSAAAGGDDASAIAGAPYGQLRISTPQNDATVISTVGNVDVAFALEPALRAGDGHKFAVALDGRQLPTKGITPRVRLNNVARGTHTLQAYVVDQANNVLLASDLVTFHLRRETVYEGAGPDDGSGGTPTTLKPQKAAGALQAPQSPTALPRTPPPPSP